MLSLVLYHKKKTNIYIHVRAQGVFRKKKILLPIGILFKKKKQQNRLKLSDDFEKKNAIVEFNHQDNATKSINTKKMLSILIGIAILFRSNQIDEHFDGFSRIYIHFDRNHCRCFHEDFVFTGKFTCFRATEKYFQIITLEISIPKNGLFISPRK